MRSKDTQQLFERALSLLEAQQSLEQERRQSAEQRHRDILQAFERQHAQEQLTRRVIEDQITALQQHLGEKLDMLHEVAMIPKGDTPTVEEMLDKARTDENMKKTLQSTLAELEFADPIIEIN